MWYRTQSERLHSEWRQAWDEAYKVSWESGFAFKDIVTGQMVTPDTAEKGIADQVITTYQARVARGEYVMTQTPL